jgi:Flp pilus assembly protein TadD
MRWRVFLILACAGLMAVPLARADETLQQKYLNIYLKINEAEQMERHGDFRGALADFKDCYDGLAKINKSDPNWETALVLHRMADCKAKIIELQPKAAEQGETADVPNPSLNADVGATADSTDIKSKLDAVTAELTVMKQKFQEASAQSDAYRNQLEAVNKQMQALKGTESADDKIAKLTAQNQDLSDKLAAAEKDLDVIRDNPKSKLGQAMAQVKNLQDQLDASQEANKALQDTTTTLKQQLDQANADLVSANQKLAAAGPGSADYLQLKHENEIMRSILRRELQEQGRRDMAKKLIEEEFDNLKLKSSVLQEHLDEATSVMTPPTTDEERQLLASLRNPSPEVSAPPAAPNTFVAQNPATASSGDTNAAPSTPTPPSPDNNNASTQTPPATTNVAATTPPSIPDNGGVQIVTGGGDTTPTNNAPSTPDTGTVTSSAPAPANAPDPNAPIPPTQVGTQTPPVPPPVSGSDTTTPPVPAKTLSNVPPAQTQVTDTNISTSTTTPTDTSTDPTQFSMKARLPDDMRETAQEAADLFKNQKYDESAAKYQSIIDKYPESLYAWSNLGVVRFQQGKFDEALKALQQAVKLSPTDAFSYSNLGIVYYQLNQFENAIDALNAAKALDPNDPKTHNYLGCACSQKGWSEVAEKEFRKAIELDPNFGDAHFNLALVYATQKPPLLELARREYNRALELGIAKDPRLEKLLANTSGPTTSTADTSQGAQP